MRLEGRVWKFGDEISTDLLYPQVAYALPIEEAAKLVFRANRPGWSDLVEPGDVIVGGRSFGMGSSRPAVALLRELGIAAVVAEQFASIFFRNCVNYAMPALNCPGVTAFVDEGDTIRIDLETGVIENVESGVSIEARRLPPELLEIVEQGGVLKSLVARGLIAATPADPVRGEGG